MAISTMDTARQAAQAAGDFLTEKIGTLQESDIHNKTAFDFVTQIDKASEHLIINFIKSRHPEHQFLAEEMHRAQAGGYRWIIDPLDGTSNYIHNIPIYSVSIALQHDDDIILGVVYNPNQNEWFTAEKGKGAFLNDVPIHVSQTRDPGRALLATGFPYRTKHLLNTYLNSLTSLFSEYGGIRRIGSAAIDMCYVACGRFEAFWELNLHPWDIAAAKLIIEEAGGRVTDFAGADEVLDTGNVIAANHHLFDHFSAHIRNAFKGVVEQ